MRFMMIVKASQDSEAGKMPMEEMLATMGKYNEELAKAGVLVEGTGLQSSSKGARVQFSGNKKTVIDGPFVETKELIAGYWIINVKSKQEAVDWALKAPNPHGEGKETHIEIRQFFELEDFGKSEAVDRHRELQAKLEAQKR
ncbi:MAG TPA: YciI family protein [Candidatus Binatia bacterium]